MTEARLCTNCRAELPPRAQQCDACGVFAGDVFDGRLPRRASSSRSTWTWLFILILVAVAATGWVYLQRGEKRRLPWQSDPPRLDTGPVGVVRQRPGGARRAAGAEINEAEAIRSLRQHLAAQPNAIRSECLVISSQGPEGGRYRLTAFDRCNGTRLGRFVVDGRGGVSR